MPVSVPVPVWVSLPSWAACLVCRVVPSDEGVRLGQLCPSGWLAGWLSCVVAEWDPPDSSVKERTPEIAGKDAAGMKKNKK